MTSLISVSRRIAVAAHLPHRHAATNRSTARQKGQSLSRDCHRLRRVSAEDGSISGRATPACQFGYNRCTNPGRAAYRDRKSEEDGCRSDPDSGGGGGGGGGGWPAVCGPVASRLVSSQGSSDGCSSPQGTSDGCSSPQGTSDGCSSPPALM